MADLVVPGRQFYASGSGRSCPILCRDESLFLNGQPAVIGTRGDGNPTAIGIVNNFNYWWGSNFFSAQRVLPEGAWTPGKTIPGQTAKEPMIPQKYVLPPQKKVVLPK